MASGQEAREGGGGGGPEEEGGPDKERGPGSAGPERQTAEAADSSRRIGPWHPPDYQRQRALADRLSNPALRASRPHTSGQQRSYPITPVLHLSPYQPHPPAHPRAVTPTAGDSSGTRMNGTRASSGPPSSPRMVYSPRRQASSAASPRSYGAVSPRRQPPLFLTPATSRKVTEEELDDIVGRVTKPTVSSRGGVDLLGKDFTYIPTPRLKTLPVVPGLERRYMGLQRVDSARMEEIVGRLTRLTSAYKAKFAPNKNVYVDMQPGAHLVGQRNAQPAM